MYTCQQVGLLRPQVQVQVQVSKPQVRVQVQVLRPQVQVLQTCTRVQVQVQVPSTHLWKFLLTIPITQLTVLAVAADLMH